MKNKTRLLTRAETETQETQERVKKKAAENESAWTERKKKKQSERARGYQWEDDGYISSPQPGQVRL